MAIHRVQIPGDLSELVGLYGLVGPVNEWFIQDVVIPVSLVSAGAGFSVQSAPLILDNRNSLGSQTAPAINTVLADTGALVAGDYALELWFTQEVANTQAYLLQRRNAGNTANIWEVRLQQNNVNISLWQWKWTEATVAEGERIRILNAAALGAGEEVQTVLYWKRIA